MWLAVIMVETRSQQAMRSAYALVQEATAAGPDVARIYGGLCHDFPVMVLQLGLLTSVAYAEAKSHAAGARGSAYALLLRHIKTTIGCPSDDVLGPWLSQPARSTADLMRYTQQTLLIMSYLKRFAASVLGVTGGVDEPSGAEA